jgi:hypothetical protein
MDRNTIRNTLANNIDHAFLEISERIAYHGTCLYTFDFLKGRALVCVGRVYLAREIDAIDSQERTEIVDAIKECRDLLIAFIRANRKLHTPAQCETAETAKYSLDCCNRVLKRLIEALRPAPVTTTNA